MNELEDKTKLPRGPVPKSLVTGAAIFVGVFCFGVMFYTALKAPTAKRLSMPTPVDVQTPSPKTVADITTSTQDALRKPPTAPPGPLTVVPQQQAGQVPQPDPEAEEIKREAARRRLEAPRASNLIMGGERTPSAPPVDPIAQALASLGQPPLPRPDAPQANVQQVQGNANKNPFVVEPGAMNRWDGKGFMVFEGSMVHSALQNLLKSDFTGPVITQVTDDFLSRDGEHVLVPKGTIVLGEASRADMLGQQRLAIGFHRLIMPDGFSVSLDRNPGLDDQGSTGIKDKTDNHFRRIFGASLAIGLLGGVAELGTGGLLTAGGTDRMRQGVAVGMANSGYQVLDRYLNILPTITIRKGHPVQVYIANDLLLPAVETHTMDKHL